MLNCKGFLNITLIALLKIKFLISEIKNKNKMDDEVKDDEVKKNKVKKNKEEMRTIIFLVFFDDFFHLLFKNDLPQP